MDERFAAGEFKPASETYGFRLNPRCHLRPNSKNTRCRCGVPTANARDDEDIAATEPPRAW